jgi:hypothetical protein
MAVNRHLKVTAKPFHELIREKRLNTSVYEFQNNLNIDNRFLISQSDSFQCVVLVLSSA